MLVGKEVRRERERRGHRAKQEQFGEDSPADPAFADALIWMKTPSVIRFPTALQLHWVLVHPRGYFSSLRAYFLQEFFPDKANGDTGWVRTGGMCTQTYM